MPTPLITFPMRPKSGADFCSSNMQTDARFVAEPKINGIRFVANLETKESWNRHNEPLTDSAKFLPALTELAALLLPLGITWVDCESWGRYEGQTCMLFVIDMIFPASAPEASRTYLQRRAVLEAAIPVWDGLTFPSVVLMPSGESTRMWNRMLELRQVPGNEKLVEGIVLKRVDSLYETQRVSATRENLKWTKFRFDQSIKQPVPEALLSQEPVPAPAKVYTRSEIIEVLKPALVATMVAASTPKPAPILIAPALIPAPAPAPADPSNDLSAMVASFVKPPAVGDVVWWVENSRKRVVGAAIEAVAFIDYVIEVRVLGEWRDFSTVKSDALAAAANA